MIPNLEGAVSKKVNYFLKQSRNFVRDNFEQIYHFKGEKAQHRLTLLPGNYKVVFRAKSSKNHIYTTKESFKLKSGQSKLIKFY